MGLFAQPGEWMELNPDYRRSAPKTGLFCCRCQRSLFEHNIKSLSACEVNYNTLQVRSNPLGKELIGRDCWNAVLKEHKEQLRNES